MIATDDCGTVANKCPVLRTCPVCARVFKTQAGRYRHMWRCDGDPDALIANGQWLHVRLWHVRKDRL